MAIFSLMFKYMDADDIYRPPPPPPYPLFVLAGVGGLGGWGGGGDGGQEQLPM